MRKVAKPEGEKKLKVCTIYRKFVQITSFSLPHPSGNHCGDSAPRLWHSPGVSFTPVVSLRLPSSEGATKQEPLRLILTCSISTVPTSTIIDGSTNCMGSFRKHRQLSETFHYQLSTVNLNSLSIVHCPFTFTFHYQLSTVNLNSLSIVHCQLSI